ncbi:glycosyltransferase family 4 protein [Rosistilla carotiformis]|uniref:glycosyltransferase family 4 protein n=1 Tax=Rosistilla carotiformis TaxID=2528017 RepID=UPI001E333082|nr:glycosyltransferase family 4 protein [Rosistilla carotiformis]
MKHPSEISAVGIFSLLDMSGYGGLETYVRDLTHGLSEDGIDVNWSGGQAPGGREWQSVWQPRIDRLLPVMTRPSMRWIPKRYSRLAGWRQAKAAADCCDVIHVVGTGWQLFGFPLLAAANRLRVPVTCWPAVHPGTWGDAPLDVDLYNAMDAIFVQSDFEANHLASLGVVSPKFIRCGCACSQVGTGDGERFRRRYRLEGHHTVVLFVGRKSRAKGYHRLREAIARLHQMGQPVSLVSIGRDLEPPYPSLPAEIDIDLGPVDDGIKQDALAACDLFVLPSEAESFGIVYLEAWRYAKPVVCGNAAASAELVERHQGGWVSDGTCESILAQIQKFLKNRSLATQLGLAGRRAVETDYTLEVIVEKHKMTWQKLKDSK